MKKLRLAAVLFAVSSFLASGNTFADDQSQQMSKVPERLDITFDYQRGGIASSQYAIWVEDAAGKPVHTIFVTRFTATRGFSERPGCRADLGGAFHSRPNDIRSGRCGKRSNAVKRLSALHLGRKGQPRQACSCWLVHGFSRRYALLGHARAVFGEGTVGQRQCRSGSRDGAQNRCERSQPEHDCNVRFSHTTTSRNLRFHKQNRPASRILAFADDRRS